MPKSDNYVCPRCQYTTPLRRYMKKHLYDLKKPCSEKKPVTLTPEIKGYVLDNRHYHHKKVESSESSCGNITHVNNYIQGLETCSKLSHLSLHNGRSIIDINDYVEAQHQETVERMESNWFKRPHLLELDRFLLLIDNMVKTFSDNHEEMNVIYDDDLDRVKIWCDGEWSSYLIESGIKRIIEILRSNYLDAYECYLYRKIYADIAINGYQKNIIRLKLDEYYKFLAIFDHLPYVHDEKVENIVSSYKPRHPDEFHDFGMKKYDKVKEELSKTEINRTKKLVLDMIKRNHRLNLKKLNMSILDLIKVDEDFKKSILKNLLE